jgi:hypothetical protein
MIEDEWSPDKGFKGEEDVPSQYAPLVVATDLGVSLDWENLRTTLAEKHAAAKKWFPELLLKKSNLLFPLRIWDLASKDHQKFKAAYFNDEAIAFAMLFIISNHLVPFPVPTPSLYCMLHVGIHPPAISSTDIALSYLVGIHNLSPNHRESLPILHGTEMIDLVRQIGDKESSPLAVAFYDNMIKAGKMQHYFDAKPKWRESTLAEFGQHPDDAPQWLCRTLVKYGLRVLQVLERQFLRLSQLGYIKGESATMVMSSRIAQWEDPKMQAVITEKSLEFMKLHIDSEEHFNKKENQPEDMRPFPSLEEAKACDVFHYGINLKYAEFVLWQFQARVRYPPPAEEEETEEAV